MSMRAWKPTEMGELSLDWIRGPGSRLDWEWSRAVLSKMIWRDASMAAMRRGDGSWGEGWGLEGLRVWVPVRRGRGEGEFTAKLAVNPDVVRRVLSRLEERDSSESERRFWNDRSEMQWNKCWIPRNGKVIDRVSAYGENMSRQEFMLIWGGMWTGTRSMVLLRPPQKRAVQGDYCLPGCLCPWDGHLQWEAWKPRNIVSGQPGVCPYGHKYIPLLTRNGQRRGCPECNRRRSAEAAQVVREAAHAAGLTAAEFRRRYGGTSAARKFLATQDGDAEETREEFLENLRVQAEKDLAEMMREEDEAAAAEPAPAPAVPVEAEAVPWYLAPSMIGSTEEESEERRVREHEETQRKAAEQRKAAAEAAAQRDARAAEITEAVSGSAAEIIRARLNARTGVQNESG